MMSEMQRIKFPSGINKVHFFFLLFFWPVNRRACCSSAWAGGNTSLCMWACACVQCYTPDALLSLANVGTGEKLKQDWLPPVATYTIWWAKQWAGFLCCGSCCVCCFTFNLLQPFWNFVSCWLSSWPPFIFSLHPFSSPQPWGLIIAAVVVNSTEAESILWGLGLGLGKNGETKLKSLEVFLKSW